MTSSEDFYNNGVLQEACEAGKCNVDQRSFKGYFIREMAATAQLVPAVHDTIMAKIATSAEAAVKTCTGGTSGNKCGLKWTTGVNDGSMGVGESMNALEAVQSNLANLAPAFVSDVAGTGSSAGNPDAGLDNNADLEKKFLKPVTTADRAGAGILTALVVMGVVGGTAVMCI